MIGGGGANGGGGASGGARVNKAAEGRVAAHD